MDKNKGAGDCEAMETDIKSQTAEEKPAFTRKPEDAKPVSKDEDMEVVESVSEIERPETVSEVRESPSKGKNTCSTIELDLERKGTEIGEPVSKNADILTVEASLESKTTETLKGGLKSIVIDETDSISKNTASIKDIESVPKKTESMLKDPESASKNTEIISEIPESALKNTESISKDSKFTTDAESAPKNTESIAKNSESVPKNIESDSEVPKSVPKDSKSIPKNLECAPMTATSVSEVPESTSKNIVLVSKDLKSDPKNIESVSKVKECVAEEPECVPKNTGSALEEPKPISKIMKSVSEEPKPAPKNTGTVSEEPKSVPKNTESMSGESKSAPKNTESVSEEPKSVPKNTESVSEESISAPKNTDSVSEEPKSVPKNTESVSEESISAPKNTESVSEEPKSVPKNTESMSEEPKSAPKNTESVSEEPKSAPKNTEFVSKDPESARKNTESVLEESKLVVKSTDSEKPKSGVKSTESVSNNPECVQKNTETVSEQPKSAVKSTESISDNPECAQKNTESVSKTSEPVPDRLKSVSKDAESELKYAKNSEGVLKIKDSESKNIESVSKDNESVSKNTETVSKDNECVSKNFESVQKNIEPVVKESESTSKHSVSPEGTESVAKNIECVSENVKSPPRDAESVAKDTEIVSKGIVSVSEGTMSVSGDRESVTENAESVSGNKEDSTGSISKSKESPTENAGLISRDEKCVTENAELVSKEAISVVEKEESVSKSKESVSVTKPVLITEGNQEELVTEATDSKCIDSVPKGEEGKAAEPVSPPKETEYVKLSSIVESEKHRESKTKESTLSEVELSQRTDIEETSSQKPEELSQRTDIEETSSQKPEEETNISDEVEDPCIVDLSNEIESQNTQIDIFMEDSDNQKPDSKETEPQTHLKSQNTADETMTEQLGEKDSGEIEMDVEEISVTAQTAEEQLPITEVKEENKDDSQEIVCVKDDSQEVVCVKDDSQEIICVDVEDDSDESHETPSCVVDEVKDGEKINDEDVTTQKKQGQNDESDYEGSSQETYCSESSLQRSDQSDFQTTGTYGCSQATTVDVADLETMPNSEADMFASQNTQEDTPASGASAESSETVVDYSDFVKGSNNGSSILKTSTTLSMIESEISSTKTDECTRKRKHTEEDDSEEKSAKVLRIAEEKTIVGGASVSDGNTETSKDKVAKDKCVVSIVNPTKVDLKEKEVEISPKADRQKLPLVSSPAASRKLDFETESNAGDKKRTRFVLVPSSSKEVEMIEEVKTDKDEEAFTQKMTETPESQVSADSSPEVEIVGTKKSRQSIEVVYASISSQSNSSWQPTLSSQKRLLGDLEEVVEVEDREDEKKDTEESSEEELHLHLSPSPSQKSSTDIRRSQKSSDSLSASSSVNHTSYSSYKSSNASSYIQNKQDSESTKKAGEFVSGTSISKNHSIHTIHEDEAEKSSQTQNSGSSSSSEHTNGLVGVDKMQFSLTRKDILSPEDSPAITDSFTTFSKVKDVAQMTSKEEQSQFSVAMDVESERRTSKRKRCAEKDNPVIHVLGSDSESDSQSTPADVQKKARIEAADLANGRKDTPSSLSLADTLLHKDATQGNEASEVIECERKVTMDIHVKLKYSKQNNKVLFVGVQHCEDVTDEIIQFASRRLSDYSSSGGLGDISSKNPSPSSVSSGPGPFPLPPNRLSLISMTSSSSSSSGGSSVAQGVLRNKQVIDGGHFVMPNQPGPRSSRDRSFRSEDATTGTRSGLHTYLVEGMDLIERVLLSIHPEREHLGSVKTTRSDIVRKEIFQKTTEEQKYVSDSPQETLDQKTADDVGVSSAVGSDILPTPANVLKETPKSSAKPLKGSKTRSTVKKRSLSFSKSKGKENVQQEKETSEFAPIPEGRKGRRTPVRNKSNSASVTPVGTDVQTPKTKAVETPDSPRKICRTPEVTSESTTKSLKPGALVFARWTDRKYYSGKIKEIGKDERWLVLFDDGNVKSLVEDFVIAVDVLSKGQLVYALAEDDDYLSGVIISVEKKRSNYMYSVELDEGNVVSVTRSSLFMTEDQAKILRETVIAASPKTTPHRKADVSLENVLEGKRSRISGKESSKTLETPGISGESKTTSKRKVSSPVSSESDAGSALDYVDGVEAESTGFEFKSGKVKGQSRSTPRKNDITRLLGPMPPQGSKIFAGKFFLLTVSDAAGHEWEGTDNSSTENTDNTEPDSNRVALIQTDVPFSKSYLAEQISAGGGTVCNRFQEIAPNKYDNCYLITNKPNLTSKFILCLAHGISVLSHAWVVESCRNNSCLEAQDYAIPAGWSLEKRQYVLKQKQRPLSRMKVGLVSEQKYFMKFWETVLKGAGASVFLIPAEKGTKDLRDLHVVVAHAPCPYDILKQLKELDKPVVSTTWIVQCLINGTKCSVRGHPRYYSSSD